jgi:signal transduction histidine kinase
VLAPYRLSLLFSTYSTMPTTDQAQVAKLQNELDTLRSEMQTLVATLSHDLRAPIRHIVSYTQLVREDAAPVLEPQVLDFLDTITQSAERLGGMVDTLLTFARVDSVPVTLGAVDLQALLQEVAAGLQAQHPERVLAWHIAPHLPRVQADASLLRQVLQQVLGNAVKFTTNQTPAVIEVQALAAEDPKRVTLEVQDNGIGFAPYLSGQLFKPFSRLHSNPSIPGRGMGLAIARKQLERMNAHIQVAGQSQVGCSVHIDLVAA